MNYALKLIHAIIVETSCNVNHYNLHIYYMNYALKLTHAIIVETSCNVNHYKELDDTHTHMHTGKHSFIHFV